MASPQSSLLRSGQISTTAEDMKRINLFKIVGVVSALVLVIASFLLVNFDAIILSGSTKPSTLIDFQSKLQFTVKYLQLPGFCFFLTIMNTSIRRGTGQANNPLAGDEHLIQTSKNVLQNTLEQFIFTASVQLALIAYLDGIAVAKVIPLLNYLFVIGRIGFVAGYPNYRSFGFTVSFLPNGIAILFAGYKLLAEQMF